MIWHHAPGVDRVAFTVEVQQGLLNDLCCFIAQWAVADAAIKVTFTPLEALVSIGRSIAFVRKCIGKAEYDMLSHPSAVIVRQVSARSPTSVIHPGNVPRRRDWSNCRLEAGGTKQRGGVIAHAAASLAKSRT
jgi:hypothetical protein